MHCVNCGRDNKIDSCVHTAKVTQIEFIFLMLLVTILPAITLGIYYNIYLDYDLVNYLEAGSISISIALIILLIAYYFFDKVYLAIFFGCHQKISRSFKGKKRTFILCARCTGLMIGMFTTGLIAQFDFSYAWLLVFTIPMIVDGFLQAKTKYESTNIRRLVTGFLAGPSIVLIFSYIHFILSSSLVELFTKIL